jgi:hypothetical protein
MDDNNKPTMTIYRIHGEPLTFEIQMTAAKEMGLSGDIEQGLSRAALAIEANGTLYVIPYSNIEHIEFTPAPEILPIFIMRNARLLSD